MSYSFDQRAFFASAATYIDRILAPTKYELVINRRAARALGLTLPTSLLGRADDLID
jgi:putative tryptophan/tyrosine transport system substrate-binding protein